MVGAAGDAAVGLAGLGAFKYFAGGMCFCSFIYVFFSHHDDES